MSRPCTHRPRFSRFPTRSLSFTDNNPHSLCGQYTIFFLARQVGVLRTPLSHFFWDELSHFSKSPSKIGLKFIFGMAEINGGLFFFAIASAGRSSFSRWCSLILARIHAKIPGGTKVATSILRSSFFAPSRPFARACARLAKNRRVKIGSHPSFPPSLRRPRKRLRPPSLRRRRLFQLEKHLRRALDHRLFRPPGHVAHRLRAVQFPQAREQRMHPQRQRPEVVAEHLDYPLETS